MQILRLYLVRQSSDIFHNVRYDLPQDIFHDIKQKILIRLVVKRLEAFYGLHHYNVSVNTTQDVEILLGH